MIGKHTLFSLKGTGSALAECFLTLGGIPFTLEELSEAEFDQGCERLRKYNPLNEIPTLVLPSGQALTESLAMTFYVNDIAPQTALIAPPPHPRRAENLRWLIFIAANIYPTFTYGDCPDRWIPGGDNAARPLRDSTDAYRKKLWILMEEAADTAIGSWFLGDHFGAIDIYIEVMSHWRPGSAWFKENAPKLADIARRVSLQSPLVPIWERNFGR